MLKIGEILFKLRDYTPIPFIVVMLIWGSQEADFQILAIGTAMAIMGELVRIYGVAYIGGVSRTRTYSTGQNLITGGPFSHVRNPLYIGNLFLSAGLVVCANVNHYFTAAFVIFFFLQYIPIVNWEENNLREIFKEEFDEYTQKVPRWVPSFKAQYPDQDKIKSDFAKALKSEKSTLTTTILVYLAILWRCGLINQWFGI
jgi:protein-S-isoprenylcysteine O-methyltransferase Ste14